MADVAPGGPRMRHRTAAIPLNAAWSSPFVRWQGSLSAVNSLDLAADVTRRAAGAADRRPAGGRS